MPRINEIDPNNQATLTQDDLIPYFDVSSGETGKTTVSGLLALNTVAVTSVAGRTGDVVIAESDVTNLTSDLALKAPLISPAFTTPNIGTATGSASLNVLKAGDTMTGPLVLAADPTVALGASTKQYADTKSPLTISADKTNDVVPSSLALNVGNNFGGTYSSGQQTEFQADLVYLSGFVSKLRLSIPDYNNTSKITAYKQAVLDAKSAGFYVAWGLCSSGQVLTTHNTAAFQSAVVTHAAWMQTNSIDEFIIGNEETYHAKIQPTSGGLTSVGTTATFVTATPHGFLTGDPVTIIGASSYLSSAYNGTYTVTVTNSTTFTYTFAGSAASPATGFIQAYQVSAADVKTFITGMATAVKAAGYTGKVSYNEIQGSATQWYTGGKGDLDYLSINLYGSPNGSESDFKQEATDLYNAYGTSAYISEFNANNSWAAITLTDAQLAELLVQRFNFLTALGIPTSYLFTWKWTSGDSFAAKKADGTFRQFWIRLAGTAVRTIGDQTISGNKTFTGTIVLPSGQALIAPALGTPASGVGTNLTGIPESAVTNLTTDLANKAAKGANADITSLTALSTALSIAQGGTGNVTDILARKSLGVPNPIPYVAYTVDPRSCTTSGSLFSANRGYYYRALGSATGVSTLKIGVAVQSGNISVAVYPGDGSVGAAARPSGSRKATTGAIACPAAGIQTVTLDGTIDINEGDWFFISADNTTATFNRGTLATMVSDGYCHHQVTAHPAPASVGTLVSSSNSSFIATA